MAINGIIAYVKSKRYTQETADSLGSLTGAPATIKSITDIAGGHRVTFEWEGTSGQTQTSTMDVMDGSDGQQGADGHDVTVTITEITGGHRITFADVDGDHSVDVMDGSTGPQGEPGETGNDGFSPVITVKTATSDTYILHIKTADDEFDTPNLKGGGTGGASAMVDLTDVALTNLQNGQILIYNGTSHKWENGDASADIDALGDIEDVNLTNLQDGQIIVWDNTAQKWVNANRVTGMNDLTDVDLANLADGQILKYNATSHKWENTNADNPTQFVTMPSASEYPQGVVQYIGVTSANYTQGYFYKSTPSVESGVVVYNWAQIDTQPSNRNYNDLDNHPEINGVEIIGQKSLDDLGINGKFMYAELPVATSANVGKICQYTGATTLTLKTNFFYQVRYDAESGEYKWVQVDVSSNASLESAIATLQTNQGDMSQLEIGGVSDIVSALNALNNKGLLSITYTEPNLVITYKDNTVYNFDVRAVLNDTQIGELANVLDSTIQDTNLLQYDSSILKYKPYDVVSALASILSQAKTYTDNEIASSISVGAYAVDSKPVYDAQSDTVIYYQNGTAHTTSDTDARFYYMVSTDAYCSSWIDGVEFTFSVASVDFDDYVSKTTDVTSTYTEGMADKTKVPNISAMDALLAIVKTSLALKVNIADIVDALTSQDATKVLSAKQGYVLNELISAKQNKMQYTTLPTADASLSGIVMQYTGTTSGAYKKGSFYTCLYDNDNDTWYWDEIEFAPDMVAMTTAEVDALWA